jgi:hypothetical protein
MSRYCQPVLLGYPFLLFSVAVYLTTVAAMVQDPALVYHYFCYGSNVLPSTMTKLRGIKPLGATAAVLQGYQLRFDGSESSRLEPSAAFVLETGKKHLDSPRFYNCRLHGRCTLWLPVETMSSGALRRYRGRRHRQHPFKSINHCTDRCSHINISKISD